MPSPAPPPAAAADGAAAEPCGTEGSRLRALLNALDVAVLLVDDEDRVVLTNPAFVEMFRLGVTPQRLVGARLSAGGMGFHRLFADRERVQAEAAALARAGRGRRGDEVRLVDGRALERDFLPVTVDGCTFGHLWVFRDVTVEAEARRGLEERNRILSELARLKTEFVAVLSHELRTPLTSINTFASMLDGADLPPDDRHAAVAAIRRNADRLLGLVADLILLAKLESGEITVNDGVVDLGRLVRDAVDRLDVPTRLRTEICDGPRLGADAALLGQLVDTVVGTVAAASASSAEVTVRAGVDGDRWRLVVRTSAAEVATAERLLATRLPHPGAAGEQRTGALAVLLARAIADRHGGGLSIAVDHPGAAVTVHLPLPG
jgi:signal transduction histidine kinase